MRGVRPEGHRRDQAGEITIVARGVAKDTAATLRAVDGSSAPHALTLEAAAVVIDAAKPEITIPDPRNSAGLTLNADTIFLKCTTCAMPSDRTLKSEISTIAPDRALSLARHLRGVEFVWKSDASRRPQLGLIAQEVELVYPSLVARSPEGTLGVDYPKLVAVLIEAVKALDADVAALRASIGSGS